MNSKLIIILILCALPATGPLLHSGLFDRVDGFLYISRFFEFNLALKSGQFPPFWAPDYDSGYGNPIFLFYSPLFFFSAEIPRLFGFSYINSVKIAVISSIILSGVAMFIFAREFWGKFGAFLSAIAYVYAPYHLVDIYARAAFSENMAFVWFPLILWSFYKLIKEEKAIYLFSGATTYAALILTHNIMTMLFTPVVILYVSLLLALNRKWRSLRDSLVTFLLGLGLSAFFLMPALLEKKYVILARFLKGYFEFQKHFLNLGNFFFSEPVNPLYDVPLSFQIGPVLMILAILSLGIAIKMGNAKEYREKKYSLIFFLSLIPLSIFLMLPISKRIWESLPLLQFTQFPWRFSGLLTLSLSFISGAVMLFFGREKIKSQAIMASIFSIFLVGSNSHYLKVPGYIPPAPDALITQETIRSTESRVRAWEDIERDSTSIDYRPKWAKKLTRRIIEDKDKLEVMGGDIKLLYADIKTNSHFFNVLAKEDGRVRIHTYWFPGWRAYIDGKEVNIDYSNEYGLMDIRVPAGEHKIDIKLGDTALRLIAKAISLISLLILGLIIFVKRKKSVK